MQSTSGVIEAISDVQESGGCPCQRLEEGKILFFSDIPFAISSQDLDFLRQQRQTNTKLHKNIAYRPREDRITGTTTAEHGQADILLRIMRSYSQQVSSFLADLLKPYSWQLDYASFRPLQEKGRTLRTRARNDLLHVDNFPTRPANGNRILRFFTNINPSQPRKWIITQPFETLVHRWAGSLALPYPRPLCGWEKIRYLALRRLRAMGFPVAARPPYDEFMLRMHHVMKEDSGFQKDCPKIHLQFPPDSCWMVFTDSVSHAALSGQYALEQTLLVSWNTLVLPEKSPLKILERLSGSSPLVDSSLKFHRG